MRLPIIAKFQLFYASYRAVLSSKALKVCLAPKFGTKKSPTGASIS